MGIGVGDLKQYMFKLNKIHLDILQYGHKFFAIPGLLAISPFDL